MEDRWTKANVAAEARPVTIIDSSITMASSLRASGFSTVVIVRRPLPCPAPLAAMPEQAVDFENPRAGRDNRTSPFADQGL
jgi:hypothetical protein